MIAAIIPARGGSKRLPGKNLQRIGGSTLVELAIRCAQEVDKIDIVAVSTDDDDIAREAHRCGAIVIPRPAKLASDTATTESVVQHAVKALGYTDGGAVICLQPTSPLRTADDIRAVIRIYQDTWAPLVMTDSPDAPRRPNGVAYMLPILNAADGDKWTVTDQTRFVPIPADCSIDIDTPEDLARAQEWWAHRAVA